MLHKLIIKNVALIDYVEIDFTKGLNVLSGETGSGKSVIIESLNFVLGAKADKSLIRSGTTECYVQVVFDVSRNDNVKNLFSEFDLDDDDTLVISRKYNLDGKNSIKINGMPATVSMLKTLTNFLVDVHGQSEHFYLMKNSNQLDLIDKCGGSNLLGIKSKIKKEYSNYKDVVKQINELGGDEQQRLTRLDILKYQVNEIESSNIKENEEELLTNIKQKLANQEKILSALSNVKNAISNENSVSDILSTCVRSLGNINSINDEYSELFDRISNVFSEINDISSVVSEMIDDVDESDYDINEIEDRLEKIKTLKKKYGNSYLEIFQFLDNAKNEIEKLENFNEIAENLILEKTSLESVLYDLYTKLSFERKSVAEKLTQNILTELHELGMNKASFNIKFDDTPTKADCLFNSSNGFDKIEFMFSANVGEPLKTLSSVISGGEMSRFMLSIKAQTAKYNEISTFIFDEIDAGISGNTAKVVAEKFAKISKDVQIVAISHLPQISSMADNNLLIEKIEKDNETNTLVKSLSEEEKILEIIRLIGGNAKSDSAVMHAKELITQANTFKQLLN